MIPERRAGLPSFASFLACGFCLAGISCRDSGDTNGSNGGPGTCEAAGECDAGPGTAGCRDDQDCTLTEACDAADGMCKPAGCTRDDDCSDVSDSAICIQGVCANTPWDCVGERDERAPSMSDVATLKVQIVKLLGGNVPLSESDGLEVKVCASGGADPNCAVPLAGAQHSYNPQSGLLTVTGIAQGQKLWLSITASGQLPVDWYSQRPPVGVTDEPFPIVLLPAGIASTLGQQFSPPINVDLNNKAFVMGRVRDCAEKAAEGLRVRPSELGADTEVFYLDQNYSLLLDEQATDRTGTVGMVNVGLGNNRMVVTTRADAIVTDFELPLRANVVTYIEFYPRNYGE